MKRRILYLAIVALLLAGHVGLESDQLTIDCPDCGDLELQEMEERGGK